MKTEEFREQLELFRVSHTNLDKGKDSVTIKSIIELGEEDIKENLVIAMEECAELSKEISKYYRNKRNINEEQKLCMLEEISDVILSINLLQALVGISDEDITYAKSVKINRLKKI